MNRQIALLLLGSMCLVALTSAQTSDGPPKKGNIEVGQKVKHERGLRFRTEVEKIFDEFKVDPTVRDKILNRIKERMEQLHSEKSEGRRFRRKNKGKDVDKQDKPSLPTKRTQGGMKV